MQVKALILVLTALLLSFSLAQPDTLKEVTLARVLAQETNGRIIDCEGADSPDTIRICIRINTGKALTKMIAENVAANQGYSLQLDWQQYPGYITSMYSYIDDYDDPWYAGIGISELGLIYLVFTPAN